MLLLNKKKLTVYDDAVGMPYFKHTDKFHHSAISMAYLLACCNPSLNHIEVQLLNKEQNQSPISRLTLISLLHVVCHFL